MEENKNERLNLAHLSILMSLSAFVIGLIVETVLLGWEKWIIILVVAFLVTAWGMHFIGILNETFRIWVYASYMMIMFLFYGTHANSAYDMGVLMVVIIMVFAMSGKPGMVNFATLTYFVTFIYDIVMMAINHYEFDALAITRLIFHSLLILLANRIASVIIRKNREERDLFARKIDELSETNRRTEDFLTNVSHELRTPINAVTGITAVILSKVKNEDVREDVFSVQRAGFRLFEQIGDILDYTEIDTGRLVVSEEQYMISSLLNDLIVEYRMLLRNYDKELIFDVDPKIPSTLVGDSNKIKKIIRHLVSNAIKFTKRGGIYVHIYALTKPYGVNLCIEVVDTGIGMDRVALSKIKERFYQVNSSRSRRAGGLGLGLSIVNGLTTAMDGFMQIESEKEHGTTAHVSIPQRVSDYTPCMSVAAKDDLCLALYIRTEKFEVPQVRDYYNRIVTHIVKGMELKLHSVGSFDDLKKLMNTYRLTHLFIGEEEYLRDQVFYESMESTIEVVLIARPDFKLDTQTRTKLLAKPLYSHAVASILNVDSDGLEDFSNKQMRCDGVKVLVVDDENMNLVVAEGIFGNYGMEVHVAGGGPEALEICEKEKFDIIFLDHMMPEMDGVEVMKRLRKMEQDYGQSMTIVALTANAVSGAREMFLNEGFDEFISKPIEYMELERVLRKILPKNAVRYVKKTIAEREEIKATYESDGSPEARSMTKLMENGIDANMGLHYCNNDRDFYIELLTKYAHDADGKQKDLQNYYEIRDMKGYQIAVHALKSTSKMIGAVALSELAKKSEEAAKRSDIVFIEAHHDDLMARYKDVTSIINETFAVEGETLAAAGEELTEADLNSRLAELHSALDTFEADRAENIISDLSGFTFNGKKLKDELRDVTSLISDFDLTAAAEKLNEATKTIMGGGEN